MQVQNLAYHAGHGLDRTRAPEKAMRVHQDDYEKAMQALGARLVLNMQLRAITSPLKDLLANQRRLDLSLLQPKRPLAMRSLGAEIAIRVLMNSQKPPNLLHTRTFKTSALY